MSLLVLDDYIVLVNVEHQLVSVSGCLWILKLIEVVSQVACSGHFKEFTHVTPCSESSGVLGKVNTS